MAGSRRWTPEQQQVIRLQDRNILVSAAAGSGKTAVLVERILKKILDPDRPVDVDRLLVVTFTRAAAAEMKERIAAALEEKLNEMLAPSGSEEEAEKGTEEYAPPEQAEIPSRKAAAADHLMNQATLLHSAQISTIDSFCKRIVEEHFHEIDLDPAFRIADEAELLLMRGDICKDLLEDYYEEGTLEFRDFAEVYATGKSDDYLEEILLSMYDFSQSYPNPEKWLAETEEEYARDMTHTRFMEILLLHIRHVLEGALELTGQALSICDESGGPFHYREALESDWSLLKGIREQAEGGYESVGKALDGMKFAVLSRKRPEGIREEAKEQVKGLREQVKKAIKELKESFFFEDYEELKEDYRGTIPGVRMVLRLTADFTGRYAQEKRKKNLLDFSDLEHLALRVLVDGDGSPKAAAAEYRDYFEEILIDEYQDSNLIQELLLSSISREESGRPNRFMVGDVKQSIYKFRQARPELFMKKYADYSEEDSLYQKIDLHKNFRSRTEVLDVTNLVFRQIMRRTLGGVEYDDAAALYPGASYPDPAPEDKGKYRSEVLLLEAGDAEEAGDTEETGENEGDPAAAFLQELDVREKEAFLIAGRIRSLRQQGFSYGDMVILLRTMSGWAEVFLRILLSEGIPAVCDTSSGYFSAWEVQIVLNLLKILDNPRQDIPLASVLLSPAAGLTPEELARLKIRAEEAWREERPAEGSTGENSVVEKSVLESSAGENSVVEKSAGRTEEPAGTERERRKRQEKHDLWDVLLRAAGNTEESGNSEKLREPCDSANTEKARNPKESETPCDSANTEKAGNPKESGTPGDSGAVDEAQRKAADFLRWMARKRHEMIYTPVHELIRKLIRETGFYRYVSAMPGGRTRAANLDMLVQKAQDFERTSFHGLFHFVRYIERLHKYEVDYGEASAGDGGGDMVRLLSIHKSKGLEFPVVFVAGMAKKFNQQDARNALVVHPDYGIAVDYIDLEKRQKAPTLAKRVLQRQLVLDNLGEELRVLYVAFTRAREKLILTGVVKGLSGKLASWETKPVNYLTLSKAGTFLDMVMPVLCSAEETAVRIMVVEPENLAAQEAAALWEREESIPVRGPEAEDAGKTKGTEKSGKRMEPAADGVERQGASGQPSDGDKKEMRLEEQIRKELSWNYTFAAGEGMKGKVTVTELKRLHLEEEEAGEVLSAVREPVIPEFAREEHLAEGTERGTLYHRVMEKLPFSKITEEEQAAAFLLNLEQEGVLTQLERKSVEIGRLGAFLKDPLAERMREAEKSGRLHRESPFVIGIPAAEIYPERGLPKEQGGELILVQGIIDAWFEEPDGLVLVDYKTDSIRSGEEDKLLQRYGIQLDYYRRALKQVAGRPVKEACLYSFALGKSILDGEKRSG